MTTKTCPHCGTVFPPDDPRQVYCNYYCKRRAQQKRLYERRREAGVCARCGKNPLDAGSYCRECMRIVNEYKKTGGEA